MKKKLFYSLLAMMLCITANVKAYQTPTADGVYYIQNVETGKFMARGNSWGTRAVADDYGTPIKLEADGDNFKLYELDNSCYMGDTYWMYADCTGDRVRSYTLASVDGVEGAYTLHNAAETGNPTWYIYVYTKEAGADMYALAGNSIKDDNYSSEGQVQWRFLSQAERDAYIANQVKTNEAAIATEIGYSVSTTLADLVSDANTFTATSVTVPATSSWTFTAVRSGSATGTGSGLVECFQGTGTFTTNLSGLSKGIYKIVIPAFYRDGVNTTCYSREKTDGYTGVSSAYIIANGYAAQIATWASDATSETEPNGMGTAATAMSNGSYANTLYTYVGDEGTLDLTINVPSYVGSGWFIAGDATVTAYSDQVSTDDADAIKATANAYLAEKQNSTVKSELQTAYDAFVANTSIANYNTLNTKNTASKTSIDFYAAVTAKYNTLTESGKTAFLATTTGVLYNNNTMTNEVWNDDFITAVKAQTENGADLTGAVQSAAGSTLDGWTCTNTNTFHVNTWSGEGESDGSNMKIPFIENWIAAGGTLGAGKIYQTIEGFQPNKVVKMTALARVFLENNTTVWAKGIYMYANDAKVDLRSGVPAVYNSKSDLLYDTYTVYGTTDENGKLELGFDFSGEVNFNWIAFKDVTLSLCESKPDKVVTDGIYYIANAAENGKQVSRGGDGENGGTEAVFADAGIPVYISTDENTGLSTIKFTDTGKYLFRSTSATYTDNDQTDAHKPSFYWTITKGDNGYIFTNKKAGGSLALVDSRTEGDNTYSDVCNLAEGINELYLITPEKAIEDGIYYVKTSDGRYLSRGDNYNTRAIVDNYGVAVNIATDATTNVTTFTFVDNNKQLFDATNGTVYTDNTNYPNWTIVKAEGGFNIINLNDRGTIGNAIRIEKTTEAKYKYDYLTTTAGTAEVFTFEEPANHAAAMTAFKDSQAATVATALDQTAITTVAGMDELTAKLPSSAVTIANPVSDGAELFQKVGDITETLTNIPNGLYKVSVKAFQRIVGYAATWTAHEAGYDVPTTTLYANDQEVGICAMFDQTNLSSTARDNTDVEYGGNYYPNMPAGAKVAMDAGNYVNEVYVLVTDNTLTFGLYKGNKIANSDWVYYKDFAVTYYGETRATTTEVKYGTICVPYVPTVTGAKLYSASINENGITIDLTDVETPEAGKPYIYEATADAQTFGYTGGTVVTDPVADDILTGVFTKTNAPVGSYVLQNQNSVVGFYKVVDTIPSVGAYRAYLTTSSEVKAFYFDQADAIQALEALTSGDAKIYDLNGRQLSKLQKGINIVNGKKIMVK